MEAVDVRGRFVWHELMTRDVPAATKFYTQLAGWKAQPWPIDPAYTVNHSSNGPQSGFFTIPTDMPAEMPAHWVTYIGTRDTDGIAAAAVRAGGSIVKEPADIKGAGRYAVLRDPQGATFAILDPENTRAEPAGMPPVGSFSWHELATTDHEAAFAFYHQLFGWESLQRYDMGPLGVYLVFGTEGVQRGGMFSKPLDQPGPPLWLPYVSVPDADIAFQTAIASGALGLVPPMTVPGGTRIAQLLDPTGAMVAVHSAAVMQATPDRSVSPGSSKREKRAAARRPTTRAKASTPPRKRVARPKTAPRKKPATRRKPAPKTAVKKKAARRAATKRPSKTARRKK